MNTYNPYVGIYKFILSLLVVAIHVEPFTGDIAYYINNCIARIAVPSFFILSAYYLFDKLLNNNWDKKIFIKTEKHLAKYYLVWLLLHSPVVILRLYENSTSVPHFIWQLFQAVCLKGPYGSLWFLPATILAFALVYYLGRKTSPVLCLCVSFPFFLFAALEIEYHALIKDIAWMEVVNEFFVAIFGWLANGLTFAFFFCAIGFYIAYTKNKVRSIKKDTILAIISFTLLFIECHIIRKYELTGSYGGAMLALIPTTYYIVRVLLQLKSKEILNPLAKYLQNMSMLIYPMHFAIMEILDFIFRNNSIYNSSTTLQYIIVTTLTCSLSIIILKLSNIKNLKIMSILYGK